MSRETEEETLHSNRWHISSSKRQAHSYTSSLKLAEKEPPLNSRHSIAASEATAESAKKRDYIPQIPTRSWHQEGTRAQHDSSLTNLTTPNKQTEGNAESDDVASSLRPSASRLSYNTSPMKPVMSLDKLAPCPGSSRWDIGECIDHGISISALEDDNDALHTHTKRSKGLGCSLLGESSSSSPKRKKVASGPSTTTSKHYISSGSKHKSSIKMPSQSDDKADTRKNLSPSSSSTSSSAATNTKSYIPTRHLPKKLHRKQKEERRRRRTAVDAALSSILEEEADEE
jgi:hypothetical protein